MSQAVQDFMAKMQEKHSHEPEFLQAVEEVAEAVIPVIEANPKYAKAKILERMVEMG